jgi:hypothetical protein
MNTSTDKRVVEGCKLPSAGPITHDEMTWIEFLRMVYDDAVPAPTFHQVVLLRQMDRRNPVQSDEQTAHPAPCAACMVRDP